MNVFFLIILEIWSVISSITKALFWINLDFFRLNILYYSESILEILDSCFTTVQGEECFTAEITLLYEFVFLKMTNETEKQTRFFHLPV